MATKPNVARLYSCFATGADSTVALIEVSISPVEILESLLQPILYDKKNFIFILKIKKNLK